MLFDPRTLFLTAVMVSMTVGLITLALGWRSAEFRSVRDWGWAQIVISAGLGLLLLRDVIGGFFGVLLADLLILGGMLLTYRSFLVYRGEPTRDAAGWTLVAFALCAVLLWQQGLIDMGLRSAAVTGVLAIIMWRCAWLLGVRALPLARRSQQFAAVTYALFGAVNLLRTFAATAGMTDDVLAPNPVEVAVIASDIVLWISLTICVIWMVVERQQEELLRLATRDPLTGAMNRNALLAEFEREQYRCSRSGGHFAIAMFDIDHFKRFNDSYGHLTGDEVLRRLVATLKDSMRRQDSVGRYGGEEFLVIMPDTGKQTAVQVAERARSSIEQRGFTLGVMRIDLTVSAGVAVYGMDGMGWDELLAAADQALYRAKSSGRNRVMAATTPPEAATGFLPGPGHNLAI
jgi:diguanylate cyclase (GGDEF)-like protein